MRQFFNRTALPALLSLSLVGCALPTANLPLKPEVARLAHPVDVTVGLRQPELYAQFEPSTAGAAAAAGCGAIPGIGILLAAACGGAAGAIDAKVNADRAKVAEEIVRPLKDAIVDLSVDQLLLDAIKGSVQSVAQLPVRQVALTKTVTDKAYEETFKSSTANGVMFVNVDYHISKDFGSLRVSARSLLYPRSPEARNAAGLVPPTGTREEAALAITNTAFRAEHVYELLLAEPGETPQARVEAWKADGARLLRQGLQDGTTLLARLLKEDLERDPTAAEPVPLAKLELARGVQADVLAERDGGKLLRLQNGALHFKASTAAKPEAVAQTASTSPVGAAQ